MGLVETVVVVAITGLVVGALARLAVPGPDPMSIWRTIALGIAGALIGGVVASVVGFEQGGGIIFSVMGAVAILLAYRRFVQRRPLTGPGAKRLPTGTDPIDRLRELRAMRDRGQISTDEFERRKAELAAQI